MRPQLRIWLIGQRSTRLCYGTCADVWTRTRRYRRFGRCTSTPQKITLTKSEPVNERSNSTSLAHDLCGNFVLFCDRFWSDGEASHASRGVDEVFTKRSKNEGRAEIRGDALQVRTSAANRQWRINSDAIRFSRWLRPGA